MRLLLDIWPSLIPPVLYGLWLLVMKDERRRLALTRGPLFWTLCSSAVLAVMSFVWLSQHQDAPQRGRYVPPVYHPGQPVVPGGIVADPTPP